MLFIAKAAGIAVLVWFYLTAKKNGQPPLKWVLLGLMGYWIAWWAVRLTVVDGLYTLVHDSVAGTVLLMQVPALLAVVAAFFIRKKLLADAGKGG